ncbi:hypothetical protein GC197_01950 [bacterium]|nr:hypothetical protein [bacterium]
MLNLRSANPLCTLLVAWAILCAVFCAEAQAEVFRLAGGGTIEGTLLNPDQSPRITYDIQTDAGNMVLGKSAVREVVAFSQQLKLYEQYLPKMQDTVEDHFKMAEWCDKNNLPDKRDYHINEVLRLDPGNLAAHKALGHTNYNGKWMTHDEWYRKRGYVHTPQGWQLPQDVKMTEARAEAEKKQTEWVAKVNTWRRMLRRGGDKGQEAARSIQQITDPYAGKALIKNLSDEDNQAIRMLLVDALSNIKSSESTMTLVKLAVDDPNDSLRDRATIALENRNNDVAVSYLLGKLHSKDNTEINRAALVLGRLKHPASILPLMDALVTTHKFQITPGTQPGRTNASFNSQGGGGMSFGQQKPQIIEKDLQNPAVHAALKQVVDGQVDYQFNEAGWKLWYANRKIPQLIDMRRDD